jgi:hypothetical protein
LRFDLEGEFAALAVDARNPAGQRCQVEACFGLRTLIAELCCQAVAERVRFEARFARHSPWTGAASGVPSSTMFYLSMAISFSRARI